MRYFLKSWLFILVMLFALTACCTKKQCENNISIYLYGYKYQEFDAVIVKAYPKNSELLQVAWVDSIKKKDFSNSFYADKDSTYIEVNVGLSVAYDYKITLTKVNKTFVATNLETKKEKCNACLIGRDLYDAFSAYTLDGTRIESHGKGIEIRK